MRSLFLLLVCVLCAAHSVSAGGEQTHRKPNIVFILADDYGWRDIGYHGAEFATPNLDRYASQGIKMGENYYVQPICSPSRGSLMTGRYPIRYGLQNEVILNPQAVGLPLDEVTLPHKLREAGYATHAVGKWHLGFYQWEYTPTYRGFDSHMGFWTGQEDHYTRISVYDYTGYDFRNNSDVYTPPASAYNGDLFRDAAVERINEHAAAHGHDGKPLFLYAAIQTPHVPLDPPPPQYFLPCVNITDPARQVYCAMVQHMDQAVDTIISALRTNNMLDNTLVVFSTDNGGFLPGAGVNLPYRGGKFSYFEGGMLGIGFVYGYGIPWFKKGTTYNGLMHMTDWFPTLLTVAGGNTRGTKPLDGVDQWDSITWSGLSRRWEILYTIDDLENSTAIRSGDWKLITGVQQYGDPSCTANCKYLFNIREDPYETDNQYDSRPLIVAYLNARILEYRRGTVPPLFPPADPQSDPALHGGNWVPWQSPPTPPPHQSEV